MTVEDMDMVADMEEMGGGTWGQQGFHPPPPPKMYIGIITASRTNIEDVGQYDTVTTRDNTGQGLIKWNISGNFQGNTLNLKL